MNVLGTLGINGKLFVAQLVNFGVVLFVMWRWVYTPLLKIMDERAKKIEQGLKDADAASAVRLAAEKEKMDLIVEARLSAKGIAEQADLAAEKEREETLKKTRQDVEQIVSRGKEQLRVEKEKMLADAKAEVADLIVAATEKVLAEKIDAKKDERLINAAIADASKRV